MCATLCAMIIYDHVPHYFSEGVIAPISSNKTGNLNSTINDHLLITKGPTGHLQCYTKI